jgi:enoyl-CoA hydratase/carnithine racemase
VSDVVRYEVDRGVAWLTIDRPEARNALSEGVRTGILDATRRFNDDAAARVLVLTGAGDQAFCAGGDRKEMAELGLRVPPPDFVPQFGRTVAVSKPTIAAVNGVAYAGGFLLALMCDLCVAAEHARFAITEAKVGRGAPWAARLARIVPPRVAMQLLVTGDPIGARRAYELGFVNEVVAAGDLRAAAQQLGERIAANAPLSVAAAKAMVRDAWDADPEAFARAEALWEPVYLSDDAQEGPRAFRERRPPNWQGR